jgi:ubiquinone/menaquinone biosynthesis C-methylase UbiE
MTATAMPKPHGDRAITGMMAKWYAANTAEMMKDYVELARRVARDLPEGSRVLEVAPGPGYFSIELAKLGSYSIIGMDISSTFVTMAQQKAAQAGVQASFVQGSASNMPFPAGSFDFLLCRAAFKNFAQPVPALKEMHRVLAPGGRGVLIDLKGDATPQALDHAVDGMGLTGLNKLMTKLVFRTTLVKSAYTRAQFEAMLAEAKFDRVEISENDIGFEITMFK